MVIFLQKLLTNNKYFILYHVVIRGMFKGKIHVHNTKNGANYTVAYYPTQVICVILVIIYNTLASKQRSLSHG